MATVIAALVLTPILALGWQALHGSSDLWPHLFAFVLPTALTQTLMLLFGVGILVILIGTSTAWLVTAYDFPGRSMMEWALLLPLAVPTYIIAYAYLDILHPIGVFQGVIRAVLGYSSPREFRLPDIRSMTGCIILLGFVLYPYVYITTRAMFLTQAANLIEAARTLGTRRSGIFWRVALPLARPAIAVGVALALMEALNDIGASEFLGVKTLTVSVYTTWVTRSDLPGAAQIALAMLFLVIALIVVERWARRRQRYSVTAQRNRNFVPRKLRGFAGWAALCCGLVPVLIGFVIPASYLAVEAWKRFRAAGLSERLVSEAANTIIMSAVATMIVLAFGIIAAYAVRLRPGRFSGVAFRLSTIGYAAPGTVIAIGILIPVAALDRFIDRSMIDWFGFSTGLLLIGSGAALIYAYTARFLAIPAGAAEAGFSRIPISFDQAARSLGQNATGTFRQIHLPLSKAALAAAGLLVFVDCMKELPATLLLRPLNFETLATHLYGEAARGTYEEASIAALAIVLIGTLPVIVLARVGRQKS
ncbi:ABC transporter permease [Phyllobacterium phragmitis]|nr:iron ABC transporter permease [Phyllobacterium phragmitis]